MNHWYGQASHRMNDQKEREKEGDEEEERGHGLAEKTDGESGDETEIILFIEAWLLIRWNEVFG